MPKRYGTIVSPHKEPRDAANRSSRRLSGHGNDAMLNQQGQNNVSDHEGGQSNGNSTAVEEIYLPPQLGSSKWQQRRGTGSGANLDSTERYTVDISNTSLEVERTVSESKKSPRKMNLLHRSSTALCKLGLSEAEIKTEIENDKLELVRDLVKMPRKPRAQAIRSLPVSCDEKRNIRNRVLQAKFSKDSVKRTCCTDCSERVSLSLRRWWLHVWHGALKEIGGWFDSAVLTYFCFIKWLFMFNVFLLAFNLSFITVPEIVHMYNSTTNSTFEGLDLLTAAGYFHKSIMFYGGYNGEVIKAGSYDMQLAYLLTMLTYMMLCGISIVYSLGKSVWKNVIVYSPATGGAWRLLCSWDFSILNEKAIHSFQKKLFIQIKESLSDTTEKTVLSTPDRLRNVSLHLAAWLLYIGLAFVSCAAVYVLSTYNLEIKVALHARDLKSEAFFLFLPILVSFINLVIPLLYAFISRLENYENLRAKLYAGLARDVLLKMSILGILCYYWLTDVPSNLSCWESFVGQDVYRMAIADFLFSVLGCVFGEYLGSLIGTKCMKTLKPPEFNITRNVLDLIYAQTLVWIGVYFSPLLPIIQIVKLFIIFYMKKVSISLICRPSTRAGLGAEMKTAFTALLFFPSYIGSLFIMGYTVWSLKPSAHCGPFQGLDAPIDAVSKLVIQGKLLLLLLSIMLIVLYFFWQVVQDRKRLISLLREQIINEGKDKAFLLGKLRMAQGGTARPQVHFLDEGAQAVKRPTTFRVPQSTAGPRGLRKGSRVGPSRPAAAESAQASAPAPTPVQPTPAASVESPQQQPQRASDRRASTAARGNSPARSAGQGQSPRAAPGERQPESPGVGRGSRVECWVEDERPDKQGSSPAPPPPAAGGSTTTTPPRFPRLEPLTTRGAQAALTRLSDRTPRPKR
ncbi:transmembrane channel-like protein 5 isoform X1 [Alosa sapidissima]|uniref:transmembrane channel-like protein 5 isoform X1 n=1 Tax=Alosa sapidissima TaxID=34773 RepID=UPI001C08AE3A|nr:transmembrane channel-like protein 5 isoform X1 [Alosa sapidissima]